MPFPLAHPAAGLPFRRWCPRYFSFSALVVGILVADVGYFSGQYHLGEFSRRFFVGTVAFCLPVGMLIIIMFRLVRPPIISLFSQRWRSMFLSGRSELGS